MNVEVACTLWERLIGLFGKRSFDGVLLLVPCNDIHTFGMRRPIDVAFVSRDGSVLEAHRNVGPNRRIRNLGAAATLERFSADCSWYEPGDLIHHVSDPRSIPPSSESVAALARRDDEPAIGSSSYRSMPSEAAAEWGAI